MVTWIVIDILASDQKELLTRYFVSPTKYDEILDLVLGAGGFVYETLINKQFNSCDCLLNNVRIQLSYYSDTTDRGINTNTEYQSFKRKLKRLTNK